MAPSGREKETASTRQHGPIRAAWIRRVVVAAVLVGLAVQLGGPAALATPSRPSPDTGRIKVICPATRPDPPGTGSSHVPAVTAAGGLQVTVPPVVFVRAESGVLWVTTEYRTRSTRSDEFYLIRGDRAETCSRPCGRESSARLRLTSDRGLDVAGVGLDSARLMSGPDTITPWR